MLIYNNVLVSGVQQSDSAVYIHTFTLSLILGFPGGSDGKESICDVGNLGLTPGSGRPPGGKHGNPLQYSCLENPRGQRSLMGYSPCGHKELDTTEWLSTGLILASTILTWCSNKAETSRSRVTGGSGRGAGDLSDSPFACKSFLHSRSHLSLECTMFWSNTYTQMTFVTLCRSHRLSEYQFPDYQYVKLGNYRSLTRICL